MQTLTREEHGEARAGRITSSSAKYLINGTKLAWERLAQILDDPPAFTEATGGPMLEGVKNEPKIARRWLMRHPEVRDMRNPVIVHHHDPAYPYRDIVASNPDRVVDGIPLEIKTATTDQRFNKLAKPVLAGYVPGEHIVQVEWHAWVMGTNACWFTVATTRKIVDVLHRRDDLSYIDEALERFMAQYKAYSIRGIRGC